MSPQVLSFHTYQYFSLYLFLSAYNLPFLTLLVQKISTYTEISGSKSLGNAYAQVLPPFPHVMLNGVKQPLSQFGKHPTQSSRI